MRWRQREREREREGGAAQVPSNGIEHTCALQKKLGSGSESDERFLD